MAFGKLSLLIGSFAAAVFNGGNNPSGHSNALFLLVMVPITALTQKKV